MTSDPLSRRQILEAFLSSGTSNPLIVVIGPTASGKTAFSISLAKELSETFSRTAEIVNADSRQFYRGLDIGTAKITTPQQQGISHHLLSVLSPHEACTIAWYQREAKRCIADIHARGNIPLLVGGSMLYVSAIIDGLEPLPATDPLLRERLGREYDRDGGTTLFARLQAIDPETALSFSKQNKVYTVRAMEIFESTGKTKSSQKKATPNAYDLLMFGMDVDKDVLSEKITDRTKHMFDQGWIDEVRRLRAQGVKSTDPAMKSVGYREIFEAIERNDVDLGKLADIIDSGTRAYAKRHMTWWKRDQRIHWIRPDSFPPQARDAD